MSENPSTASKIVKYAKDNVKVMVTVIVFGVAITLGWAKGCTVDVDSAPAASVVEVPAPVMETLVTP